MPSRGSGSPVFSSLATTSQARAAIDRVMWTCQAPPVTHWVLVQSGVAIGLLEAFLDRPAGARDAGHIEQPGPARGHGSPTRALVDLGPTPFWQPTQRRAHVDRKSRIGNATPQVMGL